MSKSKAKRYSKLVRARRAAQLEHEMRLALAHERDELVTVLVTIHRVLLNSRTYCRLSGLRGEQDHVGNAMMTEQPTPDDVPLTPAQRHELSERLDAYHRNPNVRLSWEDAQILIRRDRDKRDGHDKRL